LNYTKEKLTFSEKSLNNKEVAENVSFLIFTKEGEIKGNE